MPISETRKNHHTPPIKRPCRPPSRKALFYFLACIAAVAILDQGALGMASGSYIAISVDTQYFVAAADSRGLASDGRRSDKFCKIRILGKNVVFMQMGYMTSKDNAIDTAYHSTTNAHAIRDIANAWADAIIPAFSDISRNERAEMFNHYRGHEATTGFVAGIDPQERIVVEGVKIIFDDITGEKIKLRG